MKRRLLSITVSLILIQALFVGLDLSFDILPNVSSGLVEVDDSGGKDYLTIQEGVDAALPGDTVKVYTGVYYEDVVIDKTINLTGENRDNTIINCSTTGILVDNVDYVNVSGFTVKNASGGGSGITFIKSNNSLLQNSRVEKNGYGIKIINSNYIIVNDNFINNSDSDGIYLLNSINITVSNNTCLNSFSTGIRVYDNSKSNLIINNNCSYNNYGIKLSTGSNNNQVNNNLLFFNNISAFDATGIGIYSAFNNTLENNTISNNKYGITISSTLPGSNIIINSTIENSIEKDVLMGSDSRGLFLNTTFDKDSVYHVASTSQLDVLWFLHVNVIDYLNNPVPNARVKIEDNKNSSNQRFFTTDSNGYLRWLTVTEYNETDSDGDNIGEKIYYSPYKIIAWNDTLVGFAQPFMNESKTVTIVLYNGTLMKLEPGWNLISLPRPQLNTNIQTVLQSIEGHYDAVQWYNITDTNDPWKHHHISKPSNLNDLDIINHTMGLWVHVTDPGGTTFAVYGDELISTQNISLYPEWNLVGFPSKTNKTRDVGLGTLNFGSDVDSIWTYNATIQRWVELDDIGDYFEIGKGYWMHSQVTKVWNVPL